MNWFDIVLIVVIYPLQIETLPSNPRVCQGGINNLAETFLCKIQVYILDPFLEDLGEVSEHSIAFCLTRKMQKKSALCVEKRIFDVRIFIYFFTPCLPRSQSADFFSFLFWPVRIFISSEVLISQPFMRKPHLSETLGSAHVTR